MVKNKRKIIIPATVVGLMVVIIIMVCVGYLSNYYHADMESIEKFATNTVEIQFLENNNIVLQPEGATTGFIFYPGGKVEYTAYLPLVEELASEGILCVLVEMPFHLAVLDIDAADGIQEQYPEIDNWYIGGHSLGGSMAAAYLGEQATDYEGLVLLGSYSTEDLSSTDLEVLSIYGSEDMVMNREKYEANKVNLPVDFSEVTIEGGCHAYFGMYGAQTGDGIPSITNEEQIRWTAGTIVEWVNSSICEMCRKAMSDVDE